ncbi:MAG: 3-phosphoserine/phosphohydroxythreonine transaminase [Blastocatellia bacterium]|nr:3-phosphoserine/phosphohydroxythreonine transaminase [Blastocatellia bacterium]
MTPSRIYNFSSGPAMLPVEVLARAQAEMLSFGNSGMSVMELSHRSDLFGNILQRAKDHLRMLLSADERYEILFLPGGATMQFSMVPMSFLLRDQTADFVVTGSWSVKAKREARKYGAVREIFSSEQSGFRTVPEQNQLDFSSDAAYLHYTSNETIDGVEFPYDLDGNGVPVVCDASSNILSKQIDITKYSLLYAGAQKNLGPSGVTVVIIRRDFMAKASDAAIPLLNYKEIAAADSMVNTPNTWGIYLISLVCQWLLERGGTESIERANAAKAVIVYKAIDDSEGFYMGHVEPSARSNMNVTFRLQSEDLEVKFCTEAEAHEMAGLRGHRSVGGIRASMYNAFPLQGAERLADFMRDFARRNR